jgi:hypothetical protein
MRISAMKMDENLFNHEPFQAENRSKRWISFAADE